ncbi:MAG: nitroreductase family protein [Candidatus Xenobium sp.]|jgi:nitroreductase|nr:nitroreductase [Burkholderiales bacterium]
MDLTRLMAERYSVRKYSEKPVEEADLEAILEAGRLAPTAKNLQPQRIYVIQSPEALAKARALIPCAYNAPVLLLCCGASEACWVNPFTGHPSDETDVTIVATHMMLKATELGLGTCYVCWMDIPKVHHAFGLPTEERIHCLLTLGHPAPDAQPSSLHSERRPLAETVARL